LGASSFIKWGIQPVLGVIALLVLACLFINGGKKTLHTLLAGLTDGAKQAVPVGLACAIVGVIIGVLSLTGAATNFAGFVMKVGEASIFLSLILTMLVCLVLGMGIPTIPNYIITSSIAAPALLKLGVPLLVSHMFVFYFGIMADLTPPVALAAFAAASIAKASPMKIGFKATQIAVAGFVIPFMAVYDNALMLQGNWTYLAVAYVVLKCLLAIMLWGGVVVGHLFVDLSKAQRLGCGLSAALLVSAMPLTDEIGFAFTIGLLAWGLLQKRKQATQTGSGLSP
jgi:TRAP transporter 4TM/12TM fusion protein